jgi:hypothetical protein
MRTSLLAIALAIAACSSGKATSPPPSNAATPPPNKCAYVADHLLSLMTKTAQEAPAEELDRVRNHFNNRCVTDGWSMEAQECFLSLTTREAVDQCAAKLTEDQQAEINRPPDPPKAGSAI